MDKNYNPHFVLNIADFIITPNRKCQEWNRMLGRFQRKKKFPGIIRKVIAG